MRTILLKRLSYDERATYGCFLENSRPFCLTLEDSWKGNQTDISCIPMGIYTVKRASTPHHPDTWEVQDVPGRTGILIHVGNTDADTKGCILLGSWWDFNAPMVHDSAAAYARFQERMKNEDAFTLMITWCS